MGREQRSEVISAKWRELVKVREEGRTQTGLIGHVVHVCASARCRICEAL